MVPPSAKKPGQGSPPNASGAERETGRAAGPTLRPPGPEVGPSVGPDPLVGVRAAAEAAVPRRTGSPAHHAVLEARLVQAMDAADAEAERRAAVAVARSLAARGTELDRATRLGRRSLVLGEDPDLRSELAGWFCMLGQYALAAFTLLPLVDQQSKEQGAKTLTEAAHLLCRAGRVEDAAAQAQRAFEMDPTCGEALELLGALGAVDALRVSGDRAAEAYLALAELHESHRDRVGAFDALLHAWETDPSHPVVAERLAAALFWRGRAGAADEVLREHASACGAQAVQVHLRRTREALLRGGVATALMAAFDARSDASIDAEGLSRALRGDPERGLPSSALGFDELLERVHLLDFLAARAHLALSVGESSSVLPLLPLVARLHEGPLQQPHLGLRFWVEALAADPENDAIWQKVQRCSEGSESVLLDAFEWLARSTARGARERSVVVARALLDFAVRKGASALVMWSLAALEGAGDPDERADSLREQHAQNARAQDEDLSGRVDAALAAGTIDQLGQCARDAELHPECFDVRFRAVDELAQRTGDGRWLAEAQAMLWRAGDFERLEAWLSGRTSGAPDTVRPALMLQLARVEVRRGEFEAALDVLRPLLSTDGAGNEVAALAGVLAARLEDETTRAMALERLAAGLPGPLRAGMLAVVADAYLGAGDSEAAWRVAQAACQAEPSLVGAVAVRAKAAAGRSGPEAIQALERAVEVVVPRASLCAELTRVYESLGENVLAAVWARRYLQLCPGDPKALQVFATCAASVDSVDRWVDAIERTFMQPGPAVVHGGLLKLLLGKVAEVDAERASALAWRALEQFGPSPEVLRQAILDVAERAQNPGLSLAVQERWVASTPRRSHEPLLDIAERRRRAGDPDGAAGALLRALDAGAPAQQVLAVLEDGLHPRSSDGELVAQQVRARALTEIGAEPTAVARAWRELGALLWDLGRDPKGATLAWQRACAADPQFGLERLACDLAAFAGPASALEHLAELEAQTEDPSELARLLGVQALVALQGGLHGRALHASALALELDPGRTDVLAIAERSVHSPQDYEVLDDIYERLASQAAGRFGERATHYRAARNFERCAQGARALRHALGAFEAVPSEGASLGLVLRLAQSAQDVEPVVQAVARFGRSSKDPDRKRRVLRKAADLAARTVEGGRRRLELLSEAAFPAAESSDLSELVDALADVKRAGPVSDLPDLVTSVLLTPLGEIEKTRGAAHAVQVALLGLDRFREPALIWGALELAVAHDPSLDDYRALRRHTATLVADREQAKVFLGSVARASERAPGSVGSALLDVAAAIGRELGDVGALAELLAAVSRRGPEDAAWVGLVAQVGGDVLDALLHTEPVESHAPLLMRVAHQAVAREEFSTAAEALQQAASLRSATPSEHVEVVDELREIYARLGRRDQLEALIRTELERSDIGEERKTRLALELAALIAVRGAPRRAVQLLMDLFGDAPAPVEVAEDALTFARQADDSDAIKWALSGLLRCVDATDRRVEILRELAQHLDSRGESALALTYWSELVELAPEDPAVVDRLRAPVSTRPVSYPPPGGVDQPFDLLPRASVRPPSSRPPVSVHRASITWSVAEPPQESGSSPLLAAVAAASEGSPEDSHPEEALASFSREERPAAELCSVETTDVSEASALSSEPASAGPGSDVESKLQAALAGGDADAGVRLIDVLSGDPDRTGDLVSACRQVALLRPADPWPLRQLAMAAATDKNRAYARSVRHVLSALGYSEQPAGPPPLSEQPEQPDLVHALLFRQATPANEALGLVWEGAERLLRQELSDYGITGVERVNLSAPTALASAYSEAARALGLHRVALFQRRGPEPFSLRVALLSPPAIIASGEVLEQKAALDFAVGSALAAAMPTHALLFGMPEAKTRELLDGLLLAFGPPRRAPEEAAAVASMAEMLWQTIPARDQRRLRQLCEDPGRMSYEDALRSARRAARRAGLFVSGDLGASLQRMAGDREGGAAADTQELVRICRGTAGGRDLFGLAIGPEFAEMRWQRRPSNMPASDAWGTLR